MILCLSMKLCEDCKNVFLLFNVGLILMIVYPLALVGLHLGIHRLQHGSAVIADAMIETRRNVFYGAFFSDVLVYFTYSDV